jgi:hypothetical protein
MKSRVMPTVIVLALLAAVPVWSQTLIVSVSGPGKLTGPGIDCGSDCQEVFPVRIGLAQPARTVTLTGSGVGTLNWGGACSSATGGVCTLNLSSGSEIRVSATFVTQVVTPPPPVLSVNVLGVGKVTGPGIDCPPDCDENGDVMRELTAAPGPGERFVGWGSPCLGQGQPTCRVDPMPMGTTPLTAYFTAPVTVSVAGAGGRVTAPDLKCPGDCTQSYPGGSTVTLTASADPGYAFAGWGGDCGAAGMALSCSLKPSKARNVTAQFLPTQIRLPGQR